MFQMFFVKVSRVAPREFRQKGGENMAESVPEVVRLDHALNSFHEAIGELTELGYRVATEEELRDFLCRNPGKRKTFIYALGSPTLEHGYRMVPVIMHDGQLGKVTCHAGIPPGVDFLAFRQ